MILGLLLASPVGQRREGPATQGQNRFFGVDSEDIFLSSQLSSLMSGKVGKGAAGSGKSKGGKSVSHLQKAGLQFPVGSVHLYLKKGKYA